MAIIITGPSQAQNAQAYAPQLPALVAPTDPRLASAGFAISTTITYLARVVVPRTGTLRDLAIFPTVSAGNIEFAVYGVTAATAPRLYTTGAIACPAVNDWRVVGDPALAVTAGQHFWFAIGTDSATAAVLGTTSTTVNAQGKLPASFLPTDTFSTPIIMGYTSSVMPLPTSVFVNNIGRTPLIIARVA